MSEKISLDSSDSIYITDMLMEKFRWSIILLSDIFIGRRDGSTPPVYCAIDTIRSNLI